MKDSLVSLTFSTPTTLNTQISTDFGWLTSARLDDECKRDFATISEREVARTSLSTPLPTRRLCYAAFFGALLAASFSFSALIAGANCSITASRLNEAAFCRGGYLTKLSSWAATIACAP